VVYVVNPTDRSKGWGCISAVGRLLGTQFGGELPRRLQEDVTGLEQRLEVGQDGGPAGGHGRSVCRSGQVPVLHGQPDDVLIAVDGEGDRRRRDRPLLVRAGEGEDQPLRRDRLHDGADDVGDARWPKYEVTVHGPIMQAYACASIVSRRSRR
jgi:hypothetical protein